MTEQHKKFLERLNGSVAALFAVAQYISDCGYDIMVPAIKYAPTADVHMDYVDAGDIMIRRDSDEWERIEVKGKNTQFTGKHDFPFPDVFLSNKAAADRADPKPAAYFVVSKDLKTAIIVRDETREHWFEVKVKPKNTGNEEIFYTAPIDVVSFVKL